MNENPPAVQFEHVSKSFADKKVLSDISFQIVDGEAFCLLGRSGTGRSGTGKSVTLRLMIGLIKPDQGTISIHGKDIVNADSGVLNGVRKAIGFLFQDAALFDSLTVGKTSPFLFAGIPRSRGRRSRKSLTAS